MVSRAPLFSDSSHSPSGAARVAPARQETQRSRIRDHRQRLRARFTGGGAAATPDRELLELLLFRAIPRLDVTPRGRVIQGPEKSGRQALVDHCHTTMAHKETEQFRVLFPDRQTV